MSNNLKDLHNEIFTEVISKIKYLRTGILYQTIQIILLENGQNQNTDQGKTQTICCHLGIKPDASEDEDSIVVSNVRKQFSYSMFGTDSELEIVKIVNSRINSNERKKMEELKWIVVVACTVVGAYYCIEYLKKQKQKNSVFKKGQVNRNSEDLQYNAPRPLIPAVLCLIVPSNIVSSLTNGSPINIDGLSYLIDSASYFICTTKNDADLKESELTVTNEGISADTNREVYIRVEIGDGRNLIDKKITYILKSNLPLGETFIVEKIACLRSLAGLESFNRV
jgi:hypothetical protein